MSEIYELNHPWSIYFQEPVSSYTKYSKYYEELIRLPYFLKKIYEKKDELNEKNVQLTNFIIGTSMESALQNGHYLDTIKYQWQQLFPKHIYDFVKHYEKFDNDINVNIIIISPDDIFMDDSYCEPIFTKKCEKFKFVKIKNREYICINERVTIKIDIFSCPFPQLETRKNIIDKYNSFIEKNDIFEITNYTPTESDKKFINNFYSDIELIFAEPKFNVIINSYATFRNIRDYDNFGLFPDLLKLAIKYKIIATEWTFDERNFKYRILSNCKYTVDFLNFKVSYIDPLYSPGLISSYTKITREQIRKIKKEDKQVFEAICLLIKFPYGKIVYKKYD
jgi:hypothetical protein